MKTINPLSLDFTSLKTLVLVYELRSFSAASATLHCNQSSISYTIDRLRKVFNDPLFVRQGNTIIPTLRCNELVAEFSQILMTYQKLTSADLFNPATADAQISIGCSFYEQSIFLTHFIKQLRVLAPGLKVKVIHSGTQGLRKLKQCECEFIISPMSLDASDLHQKKLWEDHYVCVMDHQHPHVDKKLTLKDLSAANHVLVTYDGYWQPIYQTALLDLGVTLKSSVELASLSTLQMTLEGTQLMALTSAKFASSLGENISVSKAPVTVNFNSYLYWTTRTHSDPMHQWLRSLMMQMSNELFGECLL